jgi:hypothetical protein
MKDFYLPSQTIDPFNYNVLKKLDRKKQKVFPFGKIEKTKGQENERKIQNLHTGIQGKSG